MPPPSGALGSLSIELSEDKLWRREAHSIPEGDKAAIKSYFQR